MDRQTRIKKFKSLPRSLKIASLWFYLISIQYFLSFLSGLFGQSEIGRIFTGILDNGLIGIAFGVVFWLIANGLVDRDAIFGLFALLFSGLFVVWDTIAVIRIALMKMETAGIFSLPLTAWNTLQIFMFGMSILVFVLLALPSTRRLFANSTSLPVEEDRSSSK